MWGEVNSMIMKMLKILMHQKMKKRQWRLMMMIQRRITILKRCSPELLVGGL